LLRLEKEKVRSLRPTPPIALYTCEREAKVREVTRVTDSIGKVGDREGKVIKVNTGIEKLRSVGSLGSLMALKMLENEKACESKLNFLINCVFQSKSCSVSCL